MAEGGGDSDLDSLTDAQKDILHNFQDFTAINDIQTCVTKLEAHNWNLESAVNDTFGVRDIRNVPQNIVESDSTSSSSSTRSTVTSTPRIRAEVPSLQVQEQSWMDWLTGWIFAPYRLTVAVLTDVLRFLGTLVWPGFGRAHTDPVEDVLNFKKKFEENYGSTHPTMYQGSYSQALNDAKKELRFLLVYLHSEDHQDTREFCSTVLCNEGFTEYVNGNMLFWACDVNTNEGYRVSRAMRESTYPFLAVVCLRDNRMTIVWRMNGFLPLDELIALLARCIDDNEPALVAARAERAERNNTQVLRQEQDAAYRESLLEDQKKAKKRQEEENERLRIEQEKRDKVLKKELKQEEIARKRQECRCTLESHEEPSADDATAVKLRIRLPNGTLLNRRFYGTDKVQLLYDFAFAHEDSPTSFLILSNFPRKTFSLENDGQSSLNEVGVTSGDALFVQDTTEDSSDED